MKKYYTDELNVQMIVALLKAHGIKYVVASPGSANSPLVASLQYDQYFTMYSAVDERSAAYLACGIASQAGAPVVLTCTGATASRNYLPGLTEAYYRKLPLLAITSTQPVSRVGHHIAQVIDRSEMPRDTVKCSFTVPIIKDKEDRWDCEVKVNKAILELSRAGGGPVHLNLQTESKAGYTTQELPSVRKIERITREDEFPSLSDRKIGILVGSHHIWSTEQVQVVDAFCEVANAVVFCDHTSEYNGKYKIPYSLIGCQKSGDKGISKPDILIHIGEVTGDYYTQSAGASEVWRVSPDGELRDTFRKLKYVFEMPEVEFFRTYLTDAKIGCAYYEECCSALLEMRSRIPELPLSNIWLASVTAPLMPGGSVVHFGILNSLRSWNFFELPTSVRSASNVGGFGIDGVLSTLFGAALTEPNKIFYAVIGDLAFFYDMNVLGNRHLPRNLRILLVNNGRGTEFRQYNHHTSHFEDYADEYIAASGHFGCQSPVLAKNYVEALGFKYLSASSKEEFLEVRKDFVAPEVGKFPLLLEVFTDSDEESKALEIVMNLNTDTASRGKEKMKGMAKQLLGTKGLSLAKKIVK